MSKILIIDDTKFIRLTLSELFKRHSYSVIGQAENGYEGFKLYKQLKPDLVTLDVTMPVMNGIETLEKILQYDPKANVVMCSAMNRRDLVIQAIELGAKDFITKPFHEGRVIEVVRNLLA